MKIIAISDVHIDSNLFDWTCFDKIEDDVAAIIVAGDISNNVRKTSEWMVELRKEFPIVIWTAGNHDFYNTGFKKNGLMNDIEKNWCNPYPSNVEELYAHYEKWSKDHDIHFLHRSSVEVNYGDEKIVVLGATGWHDFVAGGQFSTELQIQAWIDCLNDAKHVQWLKEYDAQSVIKAAKDDADAIRNMVDSIDEKLVVVSHHIPQRVLAIQNPSDIMWTKLNGSFVNTLLEDIMSPKIKYWIYGHTHFRDMSVINGITYVCNARGYPRENQNWEPIVLDV